MSMKTIAFPATLAFVMAIAAYAEDPTTPEPECPQMLGEGDCQKPNVSIEFCSDAQPDNPAGCGTRTEKSDCSGTQEVYRNEWPAGGIPSDSGLTREKVANCSASRSCKWVGGPFIGSCTTTDWSGWSTADKTVVWEGCNCPGPVGDDPGEEPDQPTP